MASPVPAVPHLLLLFVRTVPQVQSYAMEVPIAKGHGWIPRSHCSPSSHAPEGAPRLRGKHGPPVPGWRSHRQRLCWRQRANRAGGVGESAGGRGGWGEWGRGQWAGGGGCTGRSMSWSGTVLLPYCTAFRLSKGKELRGLHLPSSPQVPVGGAGKSLEVPGLKCPAVIKGIIMYFS